MFFDEADPTLESTDSLVVRQQIAKAFNDARSRFIADNSEPTDPGITAENAAASHNAPTHLDVPSFGLESRFERALDLTREGDPTEADLTAPLSDDEQAALDVLIGYPYYPGHYHSMFADASRPDLMFAAKFLRQRSVITPEFGDGAAINVAGVFYVVTTLGEERARARLAIDAMTPAERAYFAEQAAPAEPNKILHFPQQNNVA